jgi:peptidylprolyl isomerase
MSDDAGEKNQKKGSVAMTLDTSSARNITAETARFCYLDIDIDHYRSRYGRGAAFVYNTNTRYGFSSSDLRKLGGSELVRCPELLSQDHEWCNKPLVVSWTEDCKPISTLSPNCDRIVWKPPREGNRIVVELFWDTSPMACENFATLCANGTSTRKKPPPVGASGKPLSYRNCVVHRVVPGFVMQSGDFVLGNGSGGESIFAGGKRFKDERSGLQLRHNRRGVLSMGNSGKNANSSQFFLTFAPTPVCDGKHVVFGRVVSGWPVLDAVEEVGSSDGTPLVPVVLTDTGIWTPTLMPGAGYW